MKFCTHAGVLVNDGRLSHHRDTSFFGGHPTSDPTRCGLAPVLLSSLTVLVVVQVLYGAGDGPGACVSAARVPLAFDSVGGAGVQFRAPRKGTARIHRRGSTGGCALLGAYL